MYSPEHTGSLTSPLQDAEGRRRCTCPWGAAPTCRSSCPRSGRRTRPRPCRSRRRRRCRGSPGPAGGSPSQVPLHLPPQAPRKSWSHLPEQAAWQVPAPGPGGCAQLPEQRPAQSAAARRRRTRARGVLGHRRAAVGEALAGGVDVDEAARRLDPQVEEDVRLFGLAEQGRDPGGGGVAGPLGAVPGVGDGPELASLQARGEAELGAGVDELFLEGERRLREARGLGEEVLDVGAGARRERGVEDQGREVAGLRLVAGGGDAAGADAGGRRRIGRVGVAAARREEGGDGDRERRGHELPARDGHPRGGGQMSRFFTLSAFCSMKARRGST